MRIFGIAQAAIFSRLWHVNLLRLSALNNIFSFHPADSGGEFFYLLKKNVKIEHSLNLSKEGLKMVDAGTEARKIVKRFRDEKENLPESPCEINPFELSTLIEAGATIKFKNIPVNLGFKSIVFWGKGVFFCISKNPIQFR